MKKAFTESALISFLQKSFNPSRSPDLLGDDAAVFPPCKAGNKFVTTLDTLTEGVHFYADTPPILLGQKLVNVTLSDIAAMGAFPRYLLISLALPSGTPQNWIQSLYSGIKKACAPSKCLLIGGDTVRSKTMVLSSVGIGETQTSSPVYRHGGQPGDYLYCTGFFGHSLESGHHLSFKPRIEEASWILKKISPHSMTDASDGLWRSIEILSTDQNLGALLQMEEIPPRIKSKSTSSSVQHMLFDGEDFELVFTAPLLPSSVIQSFQKKFHIPLTCAGILQKKPEIRVFWEDKELFPGGKPFQHFE